MSANDMYNRGIATDGEPSDSLVEYLDPELADPRMQQRTSKSNQLLDVLNAILPPLMYTSMAGTALQQRVSPKPSSRDDVINLQMKLDERLQERQARENGICPVREELYSQCFDELIRQVTIESPERGLLLLRVRDEIRMTIAAYQTLYQSSITFGMRKTLQAEQGNSGMQQQTKDLEESKKKLQNQVQDQRSNFDTIEKHVSEKRILEEKKMVEAKEFLKFQAGHLENFLKTAANN